MFYPSLLTQNVTSLAIYERIKPTIRSSTLYARRVGTAHHFSHEAINDQAGAIEIYHQILDFTSFLTKESERSVRA